MKIIQFVLLLCTALGFAHNASSQTNNKVICHIVKSEGHLALFGVTDNNIPQNIWYYFSERGQIIKTRSQFQIVNTKIGLYFQCIEKKYSSYGQLLAETYSLIQEEDLTMWPPNIYSSDYFRYKTDQINLKNSKGHKEGIWDDCTYDNCYYSYKDGLKNGLHYYLDNNHLARLCELKNNEFIGVYYGFLNERITDIITDFTYDTAFMVCLYNNGNKKSEGAIFFDESFEIDYNRTGIWKYYDESGNITRVDTFPNRIIPQKRKDAIEEYHNRIHPTRSVYMSSLERKLKCKHDEEIWYTRLTKLQSLGFEAIQVNIDTDSKYISKCEELDLLAFVDSTFNVVRDGAFGYGVDKAMISSDDQINPLGYFCNSFYTKKPMVYLGTLPSDTPNLSEQAMYMPHQWDYEDNDDISVMAYTNANEAELFLNSKSVGGRKKNNKFHQIQWTIPYAPGKLSVKCYDKNNKLIVEDSIHTSGKPNALEYKAVHRKGLSYKRHLNQFIVKVKDKRGLLVRNADSPITCTVEGDMRIMAMDNGKTITTGKEGVFTLPVHNGTLKVYIEITNQDGGGKVFFSSPSLVGTSVIYDQFY